MQRNSVPLSLIIFDSILIFKMENFNSNKKFRTDLLSLFTKYKLKKTEIVGYLRNFEISGYILGAISTGYNSDTKIWEIFSIVPF